MDIYLTEIADNHDTFRFPTLPERIKVKSDTSYQNYDIIGKGSIKVPKGMDVMGISWSGYFWGYQKRREPMVRYYASPTDCKNIIQRWMREGTVLKLMVTNTNINYDVTISSFMAEEFGATGSVEYNIEFSTAAELLVYTTQEMGIEDFVESRPEPAPSSEQTYTVVQGDNLWKIARKFYGGSGSDWQKIYDANTDVIESTARQYGKSNSNNGWWIYPGEVFVIP